MGGWQFGEVTIRSALGWYYVVFPESGVGNPSIHLQKRIKPGLVTHDVGSIVEVKTSAVTNSPILQLVHTRMR